MIAPLQAWSNSTSGCNTPQTDDRFYSANAKASAAGIILHLLFDKTLSQLRHVHPPDSLTLRHMPWVCHLHCSAPFALWQNQEDLPVLHCAKIGHSSFWGKQHHLLRVMLRLAVSCSQIYRYSLATASGLVLPQKYDWGMCNRSQFVLTALNMRCLPIL